MCFRYTMPDWLKNLTIPSTKKIEKRLEHLKASIEAEYAITNGFSRLRTFDEIIHKPIIRAGESRIAAYQAEHAHLVRQLTWRQDYLQRMNPGAIRT
ncbi:MAG: hypothetical protein JWL88_236 [Parcubacteria group bacterium]|nr:hypothetical protein [Parcubacteria group bacterium]